VVILVISSVALDHIEGTFLSSISPELNEQIKTYVNVDYNLMIRNSRVSLSITVGLSSFLILYEAIVVILRFINSFFVSKKVKVLLSFVSGHELLNQ